MSARWKSAIQRGLPLLVSLGVLFWLLGGVDVDAVVAAITPRVALVMVPAMALFGAVTLWIEAHSILCLLPDPPPPHFSRWDAARIKCASYLPGVVHYTRGVGGLAVLLRRRTGITLADAAGVVLTISSADLLVVVSAAIASAAIIGIASVAAQSGLVVVVVGGFFGGIALLRTRASLGPLERIRNLALFDGLRRLPLRRLFQLLLLRAFFSVCFVAGCASAFAAFEVAAPPELIVGGIMIVALVSTLPIAVAGLGTSQAAFVYVFADLAPPERLLAMSLVLSFAILSLRAAMGLVFARELTREAMDEARTLSA
jgi:hypothetical protein